MTSKCDLRRTFQLLLSEEIDPALLAQANQRLSARLVHLFRSNRPSVESSVESSTDRPSIRSCGVWASFQPTGFEPDIRCAHGELHEITWCYPVVTKKTEMEFYVPRAETAFQLNQWGLLEPDPAASAKVELGDLAGLLVPGVAFDSACNRLGRGGGYYDRLLALVRKINPKAVKIGIAHDRQIFVAELPVEPLDIRMDGVLTESRWFVSANFSALAARGSLCWESEVERKNS